MIVHLRRGDATEINDNHGSKNRRGGKRVGARGIERPRERARIERQRRPQEKDQNCG